MIVQFLGAIGVANVAMVLRTYSVVPLTKGGDGWSIPSCIRVVDHDEEDVSLP